MMIKKIAPGRPNDEPAEGEEIFDHDGEGDQADVGNDDDGDRTIKYYGATGLHLLAIVGLTNTQTWNLSKNLQDRIFG